MRIFVTGATGFAGSHLVDDLLAAGHDVFGLVYREEAGARHSADAPSRFTPIEGDLLDGAGLRGAVEQAEPDIIYHLAGQALTAQSWRQAARTIAVNTGGTANLLDAAAAWGRPRVVVVTSAEIYGTVTPEQLPITEQSEPDPHHPYGVSKWAAARLVPLYHKRYDLPVVEARPFNHIGPGQARGFVVPDFASQLAAICLGRRPPEMTVGNLSAQRDFTDVRDVVRAYQALAEAGRPGTTYIICSGQPVAIETLLESLIEIAGVPVTVRPDPARMRPSDTPVLYGSYQRLHDTSGWSPQISLRQSLQDAFAEWVARLEAEEAIDEVAQS
ncbi:MAG: GDP-mannose 4,6-dehydratase [Candidatus Promineifilaceae bacterium]|nr:GDP-mannose 4,6-dehydratase [Candidatus Promineifilaceae bacterium]